MHQGIPGLFSVIQALAWFASPASAQTGTTIYDTTRITTIVDCGATTNNAEVNSVCALAESALVGTTTTTELATLPSTTMTTTATVITAVNCAAVDLSPDVSSICALARQVLITTVWSTFAVSTYSGSTSASTTTSSSSSSSLSSSSSPSSTSSSTIPSSSFSSSSSSSGPHDIPLIPLIPLIQLIPIIHILTSSSGSSSVSSSSSTASVTSSTSSTGQAVVQRITTVSDPENWSFVSQWFASPTCISASCAGFGCWPSALTEWDFAATSEPLAKCSTMPGTTMSDLRTTTTAGNIQVGSRTAVLPASDICGCGDGYVRYQGSARWTAPTPSFGNWGSYEAPAITAMPELNQAVLNAAQQFFYTSTCMPGDCAAALCFPESQIDPFAPTGLETASCAKTPQVYTIETDTSTKSAETVFTRTQTGAIILPKSQYCICPTSYLRTADPSMQSQPSLQWDWEGWGKWKTSSLAH